MAYLINSFFLLIPAAKKPLVVIGWLTIVFPLPLFPPLCVCVRAPGYSVFVVGVADVDMTELRVIGSKPSERHVVVVDDYDAFDKIQDNLITFICETATSSKSTGDCATKSRPGVFAIRAFKRLGLMSAKQEAQPLAHMSIFFFFFLERDIKPMHLNLVFAPVAACPLIYINGFTTPGE